MMLPSLLFLTTAHLTTLELSLASPTLQLSTLSSTTSAPTFKEENFESIFHSLVDPALYFGVGIFFGSATFLGGFGWALCQLSPWAETTGNECLISSQIFGIASIHSFVQVFKTSPLFSFFFKNIPSSHSSWDLNKKLLSQIPVFSLEDEELLNFLKRRWLAKTTGCYPFHVNWMCPSFGISFQVHPESTNCYARDPASKSSDTYKKRVEAWKRFLPHPKEFPLVLTRPFNIQERLPSCVEIAQNERIQQSVEKLASTMHSSNSPVIVDLTSMLPETNNRKQWLDAWQSYEGQFLQLCHENPLDLNRILCIHRVQQKDIGGIRLLPLSSTSKKNSEKNTQFFMEWISALGLTANRVELDRFCVSSDPFSDPQPNRTAPAFIEFESKEQWIDFLDVMERNWRSKHPQKTLMFKGTVHVLKALGMVLTDTKWEEIKDSPTRLAIVQLSLKKIKQQLHTLTQENDAISFHDTISRIEQVHADFTSLLETFTPFAADDFPDIYRKHLTSIPSPLQPLTNYAIHSSGMTSLGAIFQAVQKNTNRPARILYGENTYFEIINLAERVSRAIPIKEATDQDWKEVDLIVAQFNPTVKRINFKVTEYQATEYHVEKIAEILHHALKIKGGNPLSIAIDCTLDYSDSSRVGKLLTEFRQEIEKGELNVICYRSGLKFDLFGMDNYCGAPLFMVNNRDAKWSFFDALLTDPALQTDRLSLNWFCLVYHPYVAPYLEFYRKQIFENTRAVLNKIPEQLFHKKNPYYRVIPIASDADPSFIDIKIFGPLHAFRGDLLVGVYLTIKCMQAGFPLLYRPGIGFFHPNLAVLFGQECTTVRLTVGLDPAQVDVIVRCLEKIAICNGPTEF